MRITTVACAVLLIVSCGARFAAEHEPGDDAPRPATPESRADVPNELGPASDAFELTRSEFEGIERLAEDPADSRDAGLDELLAIPGFPERLARRVVAEKGERGGWSWLKGLTPPEIEELYRFREYLLLPERGRPRLEARATGDGFSAGEERVADCLILFSRDDLTARWRTRGGDERLSAWYLACGAISRALRVHAGSFIPDFGLGLMSGGSFSSYPFTATYPFHCSKRILGNTSFYGQSLLGGAAEVWYRRSRGLFYAGRLREYRSGRFELAPAVSWGGRLEIRGRFWEIGVSSASDGAGEPEVRTVDARWRSDATNIGLELGRRAAGEPAYLCGISHRWEGSRAALLVSSIPAGVAGTFGAVNGRTLGSSLSLSGATAVVERSFPARIGTRMAIERHIRGSGTEEKSRDALRVEAERRWGGAFLRLAWVATVASRGRNIPFPGDAVPACDETEALGLYSAFEISSRVTLRMTVRNVRENDARGLFFAPALIARAFSGRLAVTLSCAYLKAFAGAPACYFYEPSPKGVYPWFRASAGPGRISYLTTYNMNKLSVSVKVVFEGESRPDCIFQAAAGFR